MSTLSASDNSGKSSSQSRYNLRRKSQSPRDPSSPKLNPKPQSSPETGSSRKTRLLKSDIKSTASKIQTASRSKQKRTNTCQSHKITEWLTNEESKKDGNNSRMDRSKKTEKSANNEGKKPNEVINKKTLTRSSSFEQYGLILPSAQEILEKCKEYENHKKLVAAFDDFEEFDFETPSFLQETEFPEKCDVELLDCKHLDPDEIKKAFNTNLAYIEDISTGERYSERHEKFHNFNPADTLTTKDLTYSTSIIVFTDDQKLQFVSLMEKALDPENKKTRYFFQVLLPELCLKVFMDVHHMTEQEATEYLDKRPIV